MKNKSKNIAKELQLLKKEGERRIKETEDKIKEVERLQKLAEEEEAAEYKSIIEQIDKVGLDNELFIGIVLTPDDIVSLVKLALETKENIKIKYNIYFNN